MRIWIFLALVVGHNAAAFEQRTPHHVKRTNGRDGATLSISQSGDATRIRASMVPLQNAHSRLNPSTQSRPVTATYKTLIHQSSIPIEYPQGSRFPRWPQGAREIPIPRTVPLTTAQPPVGTSTVAKPAVEPSVSTTITLPPAPATASQKEKTKTKSKSKISKLDIVLFTTYFCNMFVVNLSVVTIPALAAANLANPAASAAFESSVASMAPMGGAIGKIVNGFVCQRLGGRKASWVYLLGLATLSGGLSFTRSLGAVGYILMGYEFLSSIQWTSMCSVLDEVHQGDSASIARGIAIMSLSSYCGALAAKTVGATLLNLTGNWRHVTRYGVLAAMVGALTMNRGIKASKPKAAAPSRTSNAASSGSKENPIAVLKSILTSRLFWMVGIGHSLGYIVRGSDRLLVPFLFEATGFPSKSINREYCIYPSIECTQVSLTIFFLDFSGHICASMTSAVTIGLVLGLGRGTIFTQMDSVKEKMAMLKRNYIGAVGSFLGLGLCALNVMHGWVQAPLAMAASISLLSGIAASSISFQFSQVPNLVSSNVFPENKAVALSLVDAAGFFVTSQVLTVNTRVLGNFGWSGSWTFLALFLGLGATLMTKNIEPILLKEKKTLAMQQS